MNTQLTTVLAGAKKLVGWKEPDAPLRPYDALEEELSELYKAQYGRAWVFLGTLLVTGLIAVAYVNLPRVEWVLTTIAGLQMGFLGALMIVIAIAYITRPEDPEVLNVAIQALEQHAYSLSELDVIEQRAALNMSLVGNKSVVPVLILSLIVSTVDLGTLPVWGAGLAFAIFAALVIPIFNHARSSEIAKVIAEAIVEYRHLHPGSPGAEPSLQL